MSLPTSSLHSPLLTPTLSIEKSPGLFGSPCRPRRKAIRKIIASRTLHSTPPATVSAAALRNALQLATTTAPPDHEPSNARFIRLPDPTNGHNNAIQSPAAPPSAAIIRWLRGELLVSHHASSRTPLPAHTARKHCSCFSAANSAFPYAPGSSPNTKRTSRRRSLKPKLHSTEPRRPIASPITVSKSTCQRPLLLTQLARPTPAQAMRVSPLPPSGSVLASPPNAAALPESNPSHTIPPGNTITTSRRLQTPLEPHQVLTRVKVKVSFPIARHSTSRAKTKAKENSPPKAPRKDPRKAPTKAPRKDPSKVLEKEQARAKAKAKEKERATNNSCTRHFPSHCNVFFFLHCRASTRHCRSTTGNTQKRVTPWNKHAKSNCKRTVPFGNKAVKPQKLHSSG